MKTKEITDANRAGWEQAAPLHRRQNMEGLLAAFRQPGYSCLDEVETSRLLALGVAGKDVAQLCCNNGRELLSVKNMGAARCVGFDAAAGFVDQARELAAAAAIECQFVRADIYDIDQAHDGGFDLVTVTIGVLGWMPDLDAFFAVAARLLGPGGALFIHEQHPILDMVDPGKADDPVRWASSYFRDEPLVEEDGLDYYGGGTYQSKPLYWFPQKMSDIIMGGIGNGLAVEHFEELPGHISNSWFNLERQGPRIPMSYTLVFRKPV